MATDPDPEVFMVELIRRIKALMAAHPEVEYEAIGVALPGRVDLATHRLVFAPNLGWKTFDLKTPLEAATGPARRIAKRPPTPAPSRNYGAGRHGESVRNLVAVTISEGIGVGMILNGQLVTGASGLAGEFGHVTIQENGPLCACGNRGCWEKCGSNTAAVNYYTDFQTGRRKTAPAGLSLRTC